MRAGIITWLTVVMAVTGLATAAETDFDCAEVSKPAPRWEEGMLTGNGEMGGVALGNPYAETLFLTHQLGFLPRHPLPKVPRVADKMDEMKKAALAGGKDGADVYIRELRKHVKENQSFGYDKFHPAFFLKINMKGDEAKDYRCTQNFENGELVTSWTDSRGRWRRSFFISRSDNVAVVRLSGPKGQVSCDLNMLIKDKHVRPEFESGDGIISAHTVYVLGKGGYDSVIRIVADNGRVEHSEHGASITNADELLLLIQIRHFRVPFPAGTTDAWAFSPDNPYYKSKDYKANYVEDMIADLKGISPGYEKLLAKHAEIHGGLYRRVKIDLGASEADRKKTSEQLMKEKYSLALLERYYNACRYLMICSSGKYPPHLQGIWNGAWEPMWGCGYHLDSNLELCIQGNMSCNMPELMEGYFNFIESILPDCRFNAKTFYNCRGAVTRVGVVSSDALLNKIQRFPGELYHGCLGWLAHFFYDYYQFTGDREFLRDRAVPLLKEVALFQEDLLKDTEDKSGKYRFFISASPEHGHGLINSAFDISIAKAIHQYLIDGCQELGIEQENIPKWKKFISKLPPYLINDKGQLQEWAIAGVPEIFNQRHHSAFLPVYQFCEFDPEKTPELWKASQRSFQGKVDGWLRNPKSNSQNITHGMANQGQCAARLGRGDIVNEVLARLIGGNYILPNFMMHYWERKARKCFGMDPIGTIPDIVNNSLLFAWDGTLDVLPALPEQWPKGAISGILLRNQIKVDQFIWKKSGAEMELALTSRKAQDITLRFPTALKIDSVEIVDGKAEVKVMSDRNHCYCLSLPAGKSVRLVAAAQ